MSRWLSTALSGPASPEIFSASELNLFCAGRVSRGSPLLAGLLAGFFTAGATQALPIAQEWFVPQPEAQIRQDYLVLASNTNTITDTVIAVTIPIPGTKIVLDQWEDGYEVDLGNPVQSSSQIWGDGNDANGKPPGYTNDPASFTAGSVIIMRNQVPLPRNPAILLYDGRDRFGSTYGIVMTRAAWFTTPGPLLANSVEVRAVPDWGNSFVLPVGEDVIFPAPLTNSMFEHCSAYIMAAQNGTQVQIDLDGNGSVDSTLTLNQGESHLVNAGIKKGATITTSKPVQVMQFFGDINANYEARGANVPPLERWSDDYYAPVGTASDGDETYIFLYNPNASAITINYVTKLGSGTLTVPGKGTYQYLMPQDSAARFTSEDEKPFWGIGTVGARPTANNVHDWGYALVPKDFLSTEVVVGWGAGSEDGSQNGNPVWVTSAAATRIYVDYNGDRNGPNTDPNGGKYDIALDVSALTISRIFEPDKDQSALRVYTLNGALITAAWGQDPAVAGPARPFLDLGNTTPNFPVPIMTKVSSLAIDNAPLGLSVGDVLQYTVTLDNRSLFSLASVPVLDTLPVGVSYVANSTVRDGFAVTDSGTTAFPLDEGGLIVPILPARLSTVITFRVTITASGTLTNTAKLLGYPGVEASDTVVVPGGGGSTPCTLKLTNSAGVEVNYQPGDGIYVTVSDPDSNTSPSTADTLIALVQNSATADVEAIVITESGLSTGIFRNASALLSSTSAGLSQNDGTLNVQAGNTITASHVDPAFGETCPDTAAITSPGLIKQLYLDTDGSDNDATGDLDRVDPVATADLTTSKSTAITAPFSSVIGTGTTTEYENTGTSHTFTHATNTGTNRLLVVTMGVGSTTETGTAGTVETVSTPPTFAGTPMTLVGTAFSGAGGRVYIFALKNNPGTSYVMPTTGSIVFTSSAGSRVQVGATTFTGVNQTTSYGSFVPNTNTGSSAVSIAIASAVGQLVVAVAAADEGGNNQTITTTTTGGQIELWNASSSNFVSSAASTKPGAAGDVTLAFTLNRLEDWAAGGISLQPALNAGGSAIFTQTPNFAEVFSMPAGGTLGITNYVELPTGLLSGTPAITATVRNSGTTIATLTSPTATLLSGGPQTITVDGASSTGSATEANGSGSAITGVNVNHTTGSGSNRLMLVGLNFEDDNTAAFTISSVRWVVGASTQNLSLITSATAAVEARSQIWSLTAPVSGAGQLQVVIDSGTADDDAIVVGVTTFSGVDQTTPLGTAANNIGADNTATLNEASASGQLVFDVASADDSRGLTIGASQTSRWNLSVGGPTDGVTAASSTEPGAASVTMSWTLGTSDDWAICAVPIRPAVLPAIYQLDWSTGLGSAVNFTAGQALSLTVENAGASAFSVLYDSSTYPSKMNLPTSTVIHTDTVAVYDAPYPGGSLITTPNSGQTLYVRTTVGDPFGAYDITSLPLSIDGPGASGDISVILTDTAVVASTAATKTYEYVWVTGSTEGNFTITATAKEGFENTITSARSTSVNISSLDLGTPSTTEFTTGNNGPHTLQYAPNETIFVRVVDLDENTNPLVAETITVTILGSGGDLETVTLTETGLNTGIFTGGVPASSSIPGTSGDGTLYALQGSVPVVNYIDNDDPTDTGNDTAIIPAATPGVSVTKTLLSPADGQVIIGEAAQFRLRVTNTGNSTLNTVQVVDTFNATQLAYVSATPAPNSSGAGSRTWTNVGPLSSGQSVDIIVNFNGLAAANPSINTVNVTTGSGGPTASDTEPVIITRPAVTVIKTLVSPNPGPANKGDNVVFNISVQNTGTTALATVPLEDTFSDAFFEFVSATVAPDGIGAGTLLWNDISGAGNLAVNATFNVSVTLKAKGAATAAINYAAVNYAVDVQGDPVPPSDSSASVQTIAATISGYTYEDLGAPGFGGDAALSFVTVKLYSDPNGDGDPSDGDVLAITTTDATGYYEFLNLGLGKYVVVQEDQLGYTSIADTAGANNNRVPVDVIALTSYPNNNFLDKLVNPADYGAISGQVRNDTDADGNFADSESGLAGAVITVYTDPNGDGDPSDGIPFGASVTTTSTGNYSFANLPPGTYVVVETDPSGYVSTADISNPNNNQIPVSVLVNVTSTGNDFLDTSNTAALGSIGNRIWSDTNNNGILNAGEPGIDGVTVELYLNSQTPGVDSPYLVTTTSGGGNYQFVNLPAGSYRVYLPISNFTNGEALANSPLSSTITSASDNAIDDDDNGIQITSGAAVISPVITISSGEIDNSKDFGFVPNSSRGSVTGSVLADLDNDNDGDSPLAVVTLTLKDGLGNDIDSDPNTPGIQPTSTVTDSNGNYTFSSLPPGVYQVLETDPIGYISVSNNTVTPVVVTAGNTTSGIDFVDEQLGTLSGHLYIDTNGDGNQDVGEPDLADVNVIVTDSNGNPQTVITDSSGNWTATVPPGSTTANVDETDPEYPTSYTQTDGFDPTTVTAVSGSNTDAGTDGYYIPGSISGTVLADTDDDGDGDAPLAGVLLRLLDSLGSPVLDGLGQPVTTLTLVNGTYTFPNVVPGQYCVAQDQPTNYNSVSDTDGPDDNVIGNVTPITVTGGNNNGGNDFIEIELGVIGGYVRADTDINGSGDAPLSGVILNLLDGFGNPVLDGLGAPIQVATDSNGFYSFTLVPTGTYRVSQNQPAGYGSVSDVDGANNNLIGDETLIVMTPGLTVSSRDFVEIEFGAISGRVFKDTNADGTGDTLFSGVTLILLDASGNPVDADSLTPGVQFVTSVTGIDGYYRFDNLLPGDYQVAETQPSGFGSVSDVDGGNLDLIGNIAPLTVNPGQEVIERDFVEIELGSISGYVYVGSNPLANVTLTLLDQFGIPVDGDPNTSGIQPISTVTNSLGYYEFPGVIPGIYQVAQAQPYGYDSVGDIDGGDFNIIGDQTPITIAPGQQSQNNNFIESLDTCPDDWDEWKFQHPGETADANPDADAYDNFAEFAFAMPYDAGTGSQWLGSTAWIIQPSALNPDIIDGIFVRPKGAPLNVTYTLQYAATPGDPTVWQSIAITPAMFTFVDNGDCTETITIHDLASLTGLTGGKGVVRIQADLDDNGGGDGDIDHTSHTETEGWTVTDLEICCRTYNNPYQRETAFTGMVTAVSGQDLTFAANDDLDTLISSGGTYYIEVTSGENEGHRFDIVSTSGNSVTLTNDGDLHAAVAPFNTLAGTSPLDLLGDSIAIHRHRTLDESFPVEGFGATNSQATADQVQIFTGGAWTIYWLYDENDADPLTASWVDAADAGMADMGATGIPPGQGVFFNNRAGVTSILAYGEIRANNFIRPHAPGSNLVGGGYPIDQSANGTRGRAMNLATGFFGSTNFKTADSIFIWKADTTIGAPGYDSYYLLGGVTSQPTLTKWIKVGDSSILSRDAEILLLGNRSVFTRTATGVPAYKAPSPWTP